MRASPSCERDVGQRRQHLIGFCHDLLVVRQKFLPPFFKDLQGHAVPLLWVPAIGKERIMEQALRVRGRKTRLLAVLWKDTYMIDLMSLLLPKLDIGERFIDFCV